MSFSLLPETVSAVSFVRCHHGELHNPLGGVPRIVFDWSLVTELPGGAHVTQEIGRTERSPADPEQQVALVDPVTLQPTGQSVTIGMAYQVIVSLAVHSASDIGA